MVVEQSQGVEVGGKQEGRNVRGHLVGGCGKRYRCDHEHLRPLLER